MTREHISERNRGEDIVFEVADPRAIVRQVLGIMHGRTVDQQLVTLLDTVDRWQGDTLVESIRVRIICDSVKDWAYVEAEVILRDVPLSPLFTDVPPAIRDMMNLWMPVQATAMPPTEVVFKIKDFTTLSGKIEMIPVRGGPVNILTLKSGFIPSLRAKGQGKALADHVALVAEALGQILQAMYEATHTYPGPPPRVLKLELQPDSALDNDEDD